MNYIKKGPYKKMSLVMGFSDENYNYMASDSISIDSNLDYFISKNDKVFKNDDFIIGFTGSIRMGNLLKYNVKIPKKDANIDYVDDCQYLCTEFVPSVINCFDQNGYIMKTENGSIRTDPFMVLYNDKFYLIDCDFQVNAGTYDIIALGTPASYAIGALEALRDVNIPVEDKIVKSYNIAMRYSNSIKPPFKVQKFERQTQKQDLKI